MLKLRPYKACDAKAIVSWIKNETMFYQWSANCFDHYPLTAQELHAYYDKDKDNDQNWQMSACDKRGIVGHLLMRYPDRNQNTLRFGFVIVDEAKRGNGYGKEMIQLAIRFAFDIVKADRLTLGVFENNPGEMACYQACGFHEVKQERESYTFLKESWECIEMELRKEEWL